MISQKLMMLGGLTGVGMSTINIDELKFIYPTASNVRVGNTGNGTSSFTGIARTNTNSLNSFFNPIINVDDYYLSSTSATFIYYDITFLVDTFIIHPTIRVSDSGTTGVISLLTYGARSHAYYYIERDGYSVPIKKGTKLTLYLKPDSTYVDSNILYFAELK